MGYVAPTPIDDGLDGDNDVIKVGSEKKATLAPRDYFTRSYLTRSINYPRPIKSQFICKHVNSYFLEGTLALSMGK